eukprot:gene1556-32938_t
MLIIIRGPSSPMAIAACAIGTLAIGAEEARAREPDAERWEEDNDAVVHANEACMRQSIAR